MINSKQIRFDQKWWVEVEEGPLSKVRPYMSRGELYG